MYRTTTFASVLGAITLAFSLTACGDDDTTAESGSERTAGADNSPDDGDSTPGGDNSTDDTGSASAYCDEFASLAEENFLNAAGAAGSDTPASVIVEGFQPAADAAPDEVKGDWETVLDAFVALTELDTSDPEVMNSDETQKTLDAVSDLQTNFMNIARHGAQECGVEVSAGGSETGESQ